MVRSIVAQALIVGVLAGSVAPVLAESEPAAPLSPELAAFVEAYQRIKTRYVGRVDDKKLIADAINGMLSGLDPHSAYLDPNAYRDLKMVTRGEFGGLGIEVGVKDGFIKVLAAIDDTPAARAGLKPGDVILKLDDVETKGMPLAEAIGRVRGKPDTEVKLTVASTPQSTPREIKLTRALIPTRSVEYRLIDSSYAYLRISQFQDRTAENLVDALAALWHQSGESLSGIVLDLRNNPGGLVNAAVGVSAVFLPEGVLVVYTQGRGEQAQRTLYAASEHYLRRGRDDFMQRLPPAVKDMPLVLLVNGGSASASEIVAGALQDHARAIVVGTQTFGKGSVQSILPMGNETAIKLTTARYFTPNGRSIQATGITPDIPVAQGASLKTADADSDRSAIDVATANAAMPDYQLSQALNLLKELQVANQR